eukprot:UN10005
MFQNMNSEEKPTCWNLFKPLLSHPLFIMVLLLNFQYVFCREVYNIFFIAYLEDEVDIAKEKAATISAIVPFVGSISVVIAGVWLDKVKSKHWRLSIIPMFAVVTTFCLWCFAFIEPKTLGIVEITMLVVTFGLSLYGPYSLMSGVLAVDIGGQTSSGMVSGFISAAGYSAGIVVGFIHTAFSYKTMWFISTCCAGCIVLIGIVLVIYNKRLHEKQK